MDSYGCGMEFMINLGQHEMVTREVEGRGSRVSGASQMSNLKFETN